MNTKLIQKAIDDGHEIANKITCAKTIAGIKALSPEIERYADFVNEKFGVIDERFAGKKRYCELTFYLHVAIEEKEDHLEYYNLHPDKTSAGVMDFLNYLESREWTNIKNAE